jgi:hypothetical protein
MCLSGCCSGNTHMLQTFHLVSVCCSRCCSPCALTRGHARASRTHPVLYISIMRASANSRACTQWAVNAQIAEHSLVKVHVRMQNARAGQNPTNAEPGVPAPPVLVPHSRACNRGQYRYARYAPTLSLASSWAGPTYMLSRVGVGVVVARADPASAGARSMLGAASQQATAGPC